MQIRPFRVDDTDAVRSLWKEIFPDNPPHNAPAIVIKQKLKCQPELFFVGEIGGEIIGTVIPGYDGHRGWLYSIAVSEGRRRQGIATKLIRYAEQALAAKGCTIINLQVRSTNAPVAGFFRRLGYETEERISMGKRIANVTVK